MVGSHLCANAAIMGGVSPRSTTLEGEILESSPVSTAFGDALYRQCLRRIKALAVAAGVDAPPHAVEYFTRRTADVARQNARRIPASTQPDPRTGYPDSYIDDIARTIIREEPRVRALLDKDDAAWQAMLDTIYRRVRANLRRSFSYLPLKVPFDALTVDMAHHCARVVWLRLPAFPYDTSLDAWVAVLVAYEISALRRRSDFKWNNYARSLEEPLTDQPGAPRLQDSLEDERMREAWEVWEMRHVVDGYLDHLSPDQQEVIRRGLQGEDTESIARRMGRSREAVYALRSRAVKALRRMVASD